jgi:hypothetical protein
VELLRGDGDEQLVGDLDGQHGRFSGSDLFQQKETEDRLQDSIVSRAARPRYGHGQVCRQVCRHRMSHQSHLWVEGAVTGVCASFLKGENVQ